MLKDTIDVREEERFDVGPLESYLRGRLEGASGELLVRQFSGGKANLTYLLRFEDREFVLRRPPLGPVAPSAHDMAREFRVLSVLHQAFPAAPKAILFCAQEEIIGAPFLIMERRSGLVVRRQWPAGLQPPLSGPLMSRALVDTLAQFHQVDYASLGLAGLGRPDGFIQRQVKGWADRWEKASEEPLEEMESCVAWLAANTPAESSHSLVHNDYKLDNVMFDPLDHSRVVAVFDWDMCTLGDPLSDVGTLLAYWSSPSDSAAWRAMAMMPSTGFWSRKQLVDRYHQQSGRSLKDIRFYHCLGLFRLAVIIAQIFIRYRRGQTTDDRFASFGQMIPVVAREAMTVAQA